MYKLLIYLIASATIVFVTAGDAPAQTSSYSELQAAYLFNFAKYVTWPNEGAVFIIGVYGDVENINFLENTLAGKRVRGKSIQLKSIQTIEEVSAVNMIYLTESETKSISAVLQASAGKSILIITERDMIRRGAMISFVVEDDKLRFKLKQDAFERAGLTASEGLLKLAILQ